MCFLRLDYILYIILKSVNTIFISDEIIVLIFRIKSTQCVYYFSFFIHYALLLGDPFHSLPMKSLVRDIIEELVNPLPHMSKYFPIKIIF